MEINIKNIGFNVGTSGWLLSGLQSGCIEIVEKAINGEHRLVLTYNKINYYTAVLSEGSFSGEYCYHLIDNDYNYEQSAPVLNWLTPAARSSIMDAAQEWCDIQNDALNADAPIKLTVHVT